jgi:DNA-binding CsgD family transcriptional regulator
MQARFHAVCGNEAGVEECCRRAESIAARFGLGGVSAFAGAARGHLQLVLGRPQRAATELAAVAADVEVHGLRSPIVVPFRPDLIEALGRAGRPAEAAAQLQVLEAETTRTGSRWAGAALARCRLLLTEEPALDGHVEKALALGRDSGSALMLGRARLVAGERLRRARRVVDARQYLRAAVDGLGALGATAWRERAETELRATGERVAPSGPGQVGGDGAPGLADLTPQERQVALAVSSGATNREVAADLFLSPRTVENHLTRVFRKLGVRSRTELTALVTRQQ